MVSDELQYRRPAVCGVELRKRDSRSKARAFAGWHYHCAQSRVDAAWLSVINFYRDSPVVRAAKRNYLSAFEHRTSDDAPVAQRLERHASPQYLSAPAGRFVRIID